MKKIILLNKKEGETPLEALEAFRRKNKEYKDVPMTYAGRLDPMASGLLLILAGEETKNKDKYLNLDKEYEFEVLFGFSTDTYDILGKVQHSHILENVGMSDMSENIKTTLKKFKGDIVQQYPAYSSKTVNGKPLFAYAREGVEIEAPSREVTVKDLKLKNLKTITGSKLLKDVEKRISKVGGDFRQKEILKVWKKELGKKEKNKFLLGFFTIKCTSGTYVRTIANSLGEELGVPALAYSIKRTRLGKWRSLQ